MSQHPSRFRNALLATVALSSTALAACVVDPPTRPGVDYGYVAGTYSNAPAQTPYTAAPYSDPYYDSYGGYDGYNNYNGPYYGGTPYYGSAYYGSGYYYGPSTTYIYRDRNYPDYGYRSRGNSYRDDRRPNSNDNNWHDRDHNAGGHDRPNRGNNDDHRGNNSSDRGNWNHDRPARPDSRPGNTPPPQNEPPRPVMGGNRTGVVNRILNNSNRAEPHNPPAAPAKPDRQRSWRDRSDRN